jgi:uncharacterized protein YjdB
MTFTHALSRRWALLRNAATVAALAFVASCDLFSPIDTSGLDVAQVVVVPGSTTIEPEQNYQFAGYGRTKTGDSVAVAVVWSATGGTISSSGRYLADSLEGDYEVRATLAPASEAAASSGSSVVRVRKLAQLLVTPASVTLPTRGTQAFAAYGRLNGGDSVAVTVTWAATGGSISPAGLYTAGPTPGAYTVTATGRGFSATATVTLTSIPVASVSVTPASATLSVGATQQLSVVTKDSAGNTLTGRVVTWSSSNPSVATVSGSGLVTAIAAGSATITATSEGKNGTSAVTVQASPPVSRAGYYVAPSGSPTGDGSATRPWDLATALAQPTAVQPGDTIWLRGGTYPRIDVITRLAGTAANPIIVRSYPGEWPIVDGRIRVERGYVWFWGFEALDSDLATPNRQIFDTQAPGVKYINLIVHDASGVGIGAWVSAPDTEVYGCLVYNNGRLGSNPLSRGHGLYFQNSTGFKRFIDNIVFNNYSYNFHGYSESGVLDNIYLEGNVSFNAGQYSADEGGGEYLMYTGINPIDNFTFIHNYAYKMAGEAVSSFGYQGGPANTTFVFTNNYLDSRVSLHEWNSGTFTGNTFANSAASSSYGMVNFRTPSAFTSFTWNNNAYRWPAAGASPLIVNGAGYSTLATWQAATGFDLNSTLSTGLTGQHIVVRRNLYEGKRAHVIVYNWSGAATASVNLSNVLQPGDQFEVREVQNYFGPPALSGTYAGGAVSLPMAAVTAPPPLDPQDFPALSTGTEFHAFVVLLK